MNLERSFYNNEKWGDWGECQCTLEGCIKGDKNSSVIKGSTKPIRGLKYGLIFESLDADTKTMRVQHRFANPSLLEQEIIASELKKKRRKHGKVQS